MMVDYLLRLALLLPLLGLMIWGSLKLTRYLQTRLVGMQSGSGSLELVETSLLAPGLKLAVVRFHGREILLGCSRAGIVRLGEAEASERAIAPAHTSSHSPAPSSAISTQARA